MVGTITRRQLRTEEEESYFISMSDMMVGLLFIFIIMLVYFAMQYQQTTQELTGANATRSKILIELKQRLKDHGLQVEIDDKTGVLRLPEDVLFDKGQFELNASGVSAVSILAKEMASVLPCYTDSGDSGGNRCSSHHIDAIFVEGHTDRDPMRGGMDNWDLSVRRATNTYRELIAVSSELTDLKTSVPVAQGIKLVPILGVSGYGPDRPLNDGDTEEEKRKNRRIDLRFLMSTPSIDQKFSGVLVDKE